MDYIAELRKALSNKSKNTVVTGQYRSGNVQIGNKGYRPVNAGDTNPVDGKPVYCLVDGNECYVVSSK